VHTVPNRSRERLVGFVAIAVAIAILAAAFITNAPRQLLTVVASVGVIATTWYLNRSHRQRTSAAVDREEDPEWPPEGSLLAALDHRKRIAVAASCCERLLPAYERFATETTWGDPTSLRSAVALAWRAAAGEPIQDREIVALARRCERAVPDLDEPFASDFAASAQDAAVAVIRTLECLQDPAKVTQVLLLSTDAVEAYIEITLDAVANVDAIENHPALRRERQQQVETIERLAQADLDAELVDDLRAHARRIGFAAST
jgi:uncharacterized protein YjaG (DUF416 family)